MASLWSIARTNPQFTHRTAVLHRSIELITAPDKVVDGCAVFSLAMQSGCSAYALRTFT